MSSRFKVPSLDEIRARAAEIGLPEREAEKFFNRFTSNGWKVGKEKMKVWKSALANWKLNWEEWAGNGCNGARNGVSATVQAILHQKELEEVRKLMKALRDSYCAHQTWAEEDKAAWFKLRDRMRELKKLLGMKV